MRSKPVLEATDLGKTFRMYQTPSARLLNGLTRGRLGRYREHQALEGISLRLFEGETLGVLGNNGAGKTTLLGLLAGIIEPTKGRLVRPQSVGVLISLGAGFDPEASGRRNLRHWGRMNPDGPFTESEEGWIEDFSELGSDLDRSLRTYSQGMLLRLGFAVTTARRPDLLVIDEVLAVGDIFFRQKCHAHIARMLRDGTSAFLVSHNMTEIAQFCQQAIVLEQGKIFYRGEAQEAVSRYLAHQSGKRAAGRNNPNRPAQVETIPWPENMTAINLSNCKMVGMKEARVSCCGLLTDSGSSSNVFSWGQTFRLFVELEVMEDIQVPIISWSLANTQGLVVTGSATHILQTGEDWPKGLAAGSCWRVRFDITAQLRCDEYTLDLGLAEMSPESFATRQQMSTEELSGHVRTIGKVYGVTAIAIIPDPDRKPAVIAHNGLAYLPCGVIHSKEGMRCHTR